MKKAAQRMLFAFEAGQKAGKQFDEPSKFKNVVEYNAALAELTQIIFVGPERNGRPLPVFFYGIL